jgi:Family of unknown function (DUF5678)
MAPPDTVTILPAESSLAEEERAFRQLMPELLPEYKGQFVALLNGAVVGSGPDDEALAARLYERFGDAPFFIARVSQSPVVYDLPSPEAVG